MLRFESYLVEKAGDWHEKHPPDYKNVLSHYNDATATEKALGMTWYRRAHLAAAQIGKETGHSITQMAGLVSNYSPQNEWHKNILVAAHVAKTKKAIGGKGQEPFAGGIKAMAQGSQKIAAEKILAGTHYNDVLAGLKTRDFAHLIEYGGNQNPKDPKVAVDRHAWSVSAGARIPDSAFHPPTKHQYNKMKGTYIHAAHHLNKKARESNPPQDFHIEPHQVQAITWLVRQRKNNEADQRAAVKRMRAKGGGSWLPGLAPTKKDLPNPNVSVGKTRVSSRDRWVSYAKEHHPRIAGMFETEKKMKRFQDFLIEKTSRPRSKEKPPVGAGGRKAEAEFVKGLQSVGIVDKNIKPAGSSNAADVMTTQHHNIEYKADTGASAGQIELSYGKRGWDISPRTMERQPETSRWLHKTGIIKKINKQWKKPSGNLKKNYKMGNIYQEVPGVEGIKKHYRDDRGVPYMDIGGKGTYRFRDDPGNWGVPEFGGKDVRTLVRARFKNRGHKAKAGALINLSVKGDLPPSSIDLGKEKDRRQFAMRKYGVDFPYEY